MFFMSLNLYFPAGTVKSISTYKALYPYISSLISLIYFVKKYVRGAHLRGIFRTKPDI